MLQGIDLDNYNTFDNWGLYLISRKETPPQPKIYTVEIPGGDGLIDLTEALGSVAYGNRSFECILRGKGHEAAWSQKYADILAAIHGRRMQIVFPDDAGYYFDGRVTVTDWVNTGEREEMTLQMECAPYKYEINAYGANWLWDPFDFLYGIIYDNNITISGTTVVALEVLKMPVTPTFRASSAMSLQYRGNTYGLAANTDTKFYDIVLTEGINNLTFVGNGTVQITYTNGVL